MHYIEPANREQFMFLNCLDDLVSQEHYVRLIDLAVEHIVEANAERFTYKGKEAKGRKAYSPATLLKLYLYGYLNGISSSRKLEQECYRNIEVIWLLGSLKPDHKTIADYRKDNAEQIKAVSKKFRKFLHDNGFIKAERIAVDGTRVKANASSAMLTNKKIESRLAKMHEEMEDYLQLLKENDTFESLLEENDAVWEGEINRQLLRKISELQEQIEALTREKERLEEEGLKASSPSDPDARLMKHPHGYIPGYNVQIAVDDANHMIGAVEVYQEEVDRNLLEPMVEQFKEDIGSVPKEVLADKGYFDNTQIESLEKNGTTCYVSIIQKKRRGEDKIKFYYDKEKDEYRCSQGGRLVLFHKGKKKAEQYYNLYRGIDCEDCELRSICTSSEKARTIYRAVNEDWRRQYRARLRSRVGKEMVKRRRNLVEHPFGTIRYWMGKIPLLLRGRSKVATEIHLYVTAYNFRRLISLESPSEIKEMIENYDWKLA